jgi:hypothetical protein
MINSLPQRQWITEAKCIIDFLIVSQMVLPCNLCLSRYVVKGYAMAASYTTCKPTIPSGLVVSLKSITIILLKTEFASKHPYTLISLHS